MSYFVFQNNETKGPYTFAQLRSLWHAGQLTGDTLYCEEGGNTWLHLRSLANRLDAPISPPPITMEAPPLVAPPRIPPSAKQAHKLPRRRTALLILFLVGLSGFALLVLLVALAGTSNSHEESTTKTVSRYVERKSLPTVPANPNIVTAEYAAMINGFADKHDMTIEEVMRWDYVLTRSNLTLGDFDQALGKLQQNIDRALGYHKEAPKKNLGSRRLVAGETRFPQNETLSEDEKTLIKTLKLAGY